MASSGYGTDAGFLAYMAARNRDLDAVDPDDIAAARLVVSEWLDMRYRTSFGGTKSGGALQEREWPRVGAIDCYGYALPSTTVPTAIENATYEAALRELQSPGVFSPTFTPNKYKRVSIDGALSVDFVQFDSATDIVTQFPIIGQWLSTILCGEAAGWSALSGFSVRV
jgi:hypothetical protein